MLIKKLALAAMITGMLLGSSAFAAEKADAEAAIAAAKAAQKAASAVGGEWRDTGKIIKEAETALAEGNYGNAMSLAKKAEDQGHIGKAAAMTQVGAGNPQYLYD